MLFTGFLLGLLGSLHCVGMCGPIALILPVSNTNTVKKALQVFLYHLGRLLSYSILGVLFGILGKGLHLAGLHQHIAIATGGLMIVFVLFPKIIARLTISANPITRLLAKTKSQLGLYLKKDSYYALFLIGFFNGFLPCGMVYMAVVGAIAMPNIATAILYMLLFGLGTVPLLTGVIYIKTLFSNQVRQTFQKMIPAFVVIVGILFILRGLGLGIPFISPQDTQLYLQTAPVECY